MSARQVINIFFYLLKVNFVNVIHYSIKTNSLNATKKKEALLNPEPVWWFFIWMSENISYTLSEISVLVFFFKTEIVWHIIGHSKRPEGLLSRHKLKLKCFVPDAWKTLFNQCTLIRQILVSSTVWNTHFETKETEQKHASQVEKHGTEFFSLCLPDTPHPLAHTNTYTRTLMAMCSARCCVMNQTTGLCERSEVLGSSLDTVQALDWALLSQLRVCQGNLSVIHLN